MCHPDFERCFVYRCDKCCQYRILKYQTIDIAFSMLLICYTIEGHRNYVLLKCFPRNQPNR